MTNKTVKRGVSYFGNRHLDHFKNDLSEMKSSGFDYIIHTFSENDLRYYQGTLKDFVRFSKEEGLEVYVDPWGVGKVFGGEAFSEFIASYPEECQILNSGRRVAAACPNRKRFQDYMSTWVRAACSLGGDVIFWDEPHYYLDGGSAMKHPLSYKEWACHCEVCRKKFKEEFGHEMEGSLTPEIVKFRQSSLIHFLKTLCGQVHEQGLKNAVCLFPVPLPSFSRILGIEDWRSLAVLKEIDILSTDPYWSLLNLPLEEFVGFFSEKIVKLAKEFGKESEIWIQAFKIPKARTKEISRAIEIVSSFDPSRIAVWSYKATACMSSLACDEPQIVWDNICNELKSIG